MILPAYWASPDARTNFTTARCPSQVVDKEGAVQIYEAISLMKATMKRIQNVDMKQLKDSLVASLITAIVIIAAYKLFLALLSAAAYGAAYLLIVIVVAQVAMAVEEGNKPACDRTIDVTATVVA